MTLPSFFAASINCGVIAVAGGAAARAGTANTVPIASAEEPLSTSRLEMIGVFMGFSPLSVLTSVVRDVVVSSAEHEAVLGRQMEPHGSALRNVLGRRGNHAHLRAVRNLHHIIAARSQKDLTRHSSLQQIVQARRLGREQFGDVLANRD